MTRSLVVALLFSLSSQAFAGWAIVRGRISPMTAQSNRTLVDAYVRGEAVGASFDVDLKLVDLISAQGFLVSMPFDTVLPECDGPATVRFTVDDRESFQLLSVRCAGAAEPEATPLELELGGSLRKQPREIETVTSALKATFNAECEGPTGDAWIESTRRNPVTGSHGVTFACFAPRNLKLLVTWTFDDQGRLARPVEITEKKLSEREYARQRYRVKVSPR